MPRRDQQRDQLTPIYDTRTKTTKYHDYFSLMAHFNIDSTRSKHYDTDLPEDQRISLFSTKLEELQTGNDHEVFLSLCDDVMLNYRLLVQVLYDPDGLFSIIESALSALTLEVPDNSDFLASKTVYLGIIRALPDLFRDLGPSHKHFILTSLAILRLNDVCKHPELFVEAIQSLLLSLKYLGGAIPEGIWDTILSYARQMERMLWPNLAEIPAYLVRVHSRHDDCLSEIFTSITGPLESTMANLVLLLACRRPDGTLHSRFDIIVKSYFSIPKSDTDNWLVDLTTLFAEAEMDSAALSQVILSVARHAVKLLSDPSQQYEVQSALLSLAMFYPNKMTFSGVSDLYHLIVANKGAFNGNFCLLTLCLLAISTSLHTECENDLVTTFFKYSHTDLCNYSVFYSLYAMVQDFSRHHKRDIFIDTFKSMYSSSLSEDHSPYIRLYLFCEGVCDSPSNSEVNAIVETIEKDFVHGLENENGYMLCTVLACLYSHSLLSGKHTKALQSLLKSIDASYLDMLSVGRIAKKPAVLTTQGALITILLSLLIQVTPGSPEYFLTLLESIVSIPYDSLFDVLAIRLASVPLDELYKAILNSELPLIMLTSPNGVMRRSMLRIVSLLGGASRGFAIIGQYASLFPLTNVFEVQHMMTQLQKQLSGFLEVSSAKASGDSARVIPIVAAATCGLLYMRFAPVADGAVVLLRLFAEMRPAEVSHVFERYLWKFIFELSTYDVKNPVFELVHNFSMEAEYPYPYTLDGQDDQGAEERVYRSDNKFRARIMTAEREQVAIRLNLLVDKATVRSTHLLTSKVVAQLLLGIDTIKYIGVNTILPSESLKIVTLLAEKAIWMTHFTNVFSNTCVHGLITAYVKRINLGNTSEGYEGSEIHSRSLDLMSKLFCLLADRIVDDSRTELMGAIKLVFSTASLEYMVPNCVILYYFLTKAPFIHVLGRMANLQTFTDQLLSLRFSSSEVAEPPYKLTRAGFDELYELCTKKLSRKQMYERDYGGISLIHEAYRADFMDIALYLMAGKVVRTGRSFNYISGVANAAVGGRSVGSDDSRRRTIFAFAEQNMNPQERNRMYGILIAPIFNKLFNDVTINGTEAEIVDFLLHRINLEDICGLASRVPNVHGNMIRGFCNTCTMMFPYISSAYIATTYLHVVLILATFWFFDLDTHAHLTDWYTSSLDTYRTDAIARNEAKKIPQQGVDIGGIEIDLIRSTILRTIRTFITCCFEITDSEARLQEIFGTSARQSTLTFFKVVYALISNFYIKNESEPCSNSLVRMYTVLSRYPLRVERYMQWNYLFIDDLLVHLRPHLKQSLTILRVFTTLATALLDSCTQTLDTPEYTLLLEKLPSIKKIFTERLLLCLRKRLSTKYFREFTIGYIMPENLVSSLCRESLTTVHTLLLCDAESKRFNFVTPVIEELCEVFHYALNVDSTELSSAILSFYELVSPLCTHNLLLPLVMRNKLVDARPVLAKLFRRYGAIEAIEALAIPSETYSKAGLLSLQDYVEIYTLLYKLGIPHNESRLESIQRLSIYLCHSKMALGMALHFLTDGSDAERSAASTLLRTFTLQPPAEGSRHGDSWKAAQVLLLNYVHAYISQSVAHNVQLDSKRRRGRSELLLFMQVYAGYGADRKVLCNVREIFSPEDLTILLDERFNFTRELDSETAQWPMPSLRCLLNATRPDYLCVYQLTDFVKLADASTSVRISAFGTVFSFLCDTLLGRLIMSNAFGCRLNQNIITNILLPISLQEYLTVNDDKLDAMFLNFLAACGLYLDWARYKATLLYLLGQVNNSPNEDKLIQALNSFLDNFRFITTSRGSSAAQDESLDSDGAESSSESELEVSSDSGDMGAADDVKNELGNPPSLSLLSAPGTSFATGFDISSKENDPDAEQENQEFEKALSGMRTASYIRKNDLIIATAVGETRKGQSEAVEDPLQLLFKSITEYAPAQVLSHVSRIFIPQVQRYINRRLGTMRHRYLLATTLSKLIAKLPWEQRQRRLNHLVIVILKDLASTDQDARAACRRCLSHISMLLGPKNLGTILLSIRTHCAKEFIGVHLAAYVYYEILEHMVLIPHQTLLAIIQNPAIILKLPYVDTSSCNVSPLPDAITPISLRQIIAVIVRDMFSAQAQEQKARSLLSIKHIEVGESRSTDIIRLTAASLSFANINQTVFFIEPLFRGCAYSFSSTQQDAIVHSLLAGWFTNSTVTEETLLEFIHYMMSPKCFYHALIPQIVDACNKLTKQEKIINARVEEDDLRRARAITDIRNEHMLLEPSPKRLYQRIGSISGGFSGVGSSYDTTVPHKLVGALLRHGIEKHYGDPYVHEYMPYFAAIASGTEESVQTLPHDPQDPIAILPPPASRAPTISVSRYPEIADYVLLMLSSRAAFCRASGFHSLAAMMPNYPTVRTKLIASECCKALYRTSDKQELEACFRLINVILTNNYDLFSNEDYSLIVKVSSLMLNKSLKSLLAFRMIQLIVEKNIDVPEVYETMTYFCKVAAMVEGHEQTASLIKALSHFIVAYEMTHKKRIVYIRNLLKVAAEFETNAGRRVVLACLREVYREIDAETLSGCVDISVVSFVVTISNCSQLGEGSDQVISEAMQTLAIFIKRCEETGYQRCPLYFVRSILANEKDMPQQTSVLILLSCLSETILSVADAEDVQEHIADACISALTTLLEVVVDLQDVVLRKMRKAQDNIDLAAASFRLFASVIQLLSLAPDFEAKYNTLFVQLQSFFSEDTYRSVLLSAMPDLRSRSLTVCNILLSHMQGQLSSGSSEASLKPFVYLIEPYILNIGDTLLTNLDKHRTAVILGDLLCASARDADASHYKVLNAFRLVDSTLLEIPASHPHLKISLIGAVLCFFSKFQRDDQTLLELLTKAFIQTLLRLRYFHTVEMDPRYETAEEFEERNPEVLHERHVCDIVNSTLDKLEQISTGTRSFTELLNESEQAVDAEPFEPPERRFRRPVKKNSVLEAMLKVSYYIGDKN
ncbi:Hypothetical protein GLP15_1855 [Giardia lamblia P15]|uniref:U3 small nucleolar RNA-associated protein 20 domain-containing protein n=1 Tax=Giardia intestinalis (strain P15) TaxID=658858 RepID=E1F2C6_GIAIA|nr:Hypothetical protein GLP15_1855 [Giardia lamblia P15]